MEETEKRIIHQQAILDTLTGLYNRRYMDVYLEHEIKRSLQSQCTIGIVAIDIDHFKDLNDNWGSQVGDIVLSRLGQLILMNIHGDDVACRYGGEEFILILPESSHEDTVRRAEQLREKVKRSTWIVDTIAHDITISLGVAIFPDNGTTGYELLQAADTRLYRAKREGRDRVVSEGEFLIMNLYEDIKQHFRNNTHQPPNKESVLADNRALTIEQKSNTPKSNTPKNPNKESTIKGNRVLTGEELHDLQRLLVANRYEGQTTVVGLMGFLDVALRHQSDPKSIIAMISQDRNKWYHSLADSLAMPCIYLSLLLNDPIRWNSIRLDTVIESALQRIEPYLIRVSFPEHVPYIKGDIYYLPIAIAYLLYKGRCSTPSLTLQCERQKPGILGRIKVEKFPLNTSIDDLFRPGGESENRLAIAKLIFENYGSPLKTVESDEGYEFEFFLLPGDGFPQDDTMVRLSKDSLKMCKPNTPESCVE